MTPKEKAEELVDRFVDRVVSIDSTDASKKCALICVDEILNGVVPDVEDDIWFWQEVKKEIEKL